MRLYVEPIIITVMIVGVLVQIFTWGYDRLHPTANVCIEVDASGDCMAWQTQRVPYQRPPKEI